MFKMIATLGPCLKKKLHSYTRTTPSCTHVLIDACVQGLQKRKYCNMVISILQATCDRRIYLRANAAKYIKYNTIDYKTEIY